MIKKLRLPNHQDIAKKLSIRLFYTYFCYFLCFYFFHKSIFSRAWVFLSIFSGSRYFLASDARKRCICSAGSWFWFYLIQNLMKNWYMTLKISPLVCMVAKNASKVEKSGEILVFRISTANHVLRGKNDISRTNRYFLIL